MVADITNGILPVNRELAIELGALQLQASEGNFDNSKEIVKE
jgi:hypothetical protein